MIRLVHFADLHLGIEQYGSLDPSTGLSTRVQDFLRVFDAVVDFAVEERVDAVLFAGDAFKNRDPNPTVQRAFAERMRRLIETRIPTVLLVGNHDLPSAVTRATPVDIYHALGLPGISVARRIELLDLPLRETRLQVVTLPWVPMSPFLSNDEIRSLDQLEVERRFRELVSAAVRQVLSRLDPDRPAVFLGHVSLEGARLGSERGILLGRDPVFSTVELGLHEHPLDYVALGHIHRHQVIAARPPAVYAGSLERVDFGEEHEPKGFVVVEIEPGPYPERRVRWQFHAVPARHFLTLRVKLTAPDPMAVVERVLDREARAIDGAIVKVVLQLQSELADGIRLNDVRLALLRRGAAHVAALVREVEPSDRPRIELTANQATDPLAMLQRWVEFRNLPANVRPLVVERGRELIQRARETSQ
jgi:exonuclease SbcD